jgi:hypothetical protein
MPPLFSALEARLGYAVGHHTSGQAVALGAREDGRRREQYRIQIYRAQALLARLTSTVIVRII